jgi:hypothetical protein
MIRRPAIATVVLLGLLTLAFSAQQSGTTYGDRFRFTVTGCTLLSGSGSPESAVTGSVCDLYVRSDMSGSNPSVYYKATGTATNTGWVALLGSGAAGPTDATYLTQTANSTLSAEQALGALASGILKSTTTTGVVSIAAPDTDYLAPTSMIDGASVTTQRVGVTTLTDASATTLLTIAMADTARTGGELAFAVDTTDASADSDVATGAVRFAAQRKGGSITCAIGTIGTGVVTKSHGGADLTVAATCDATSGTAIVLKLTADTALTATTFKAHWHLTMLKGHGAIS